MNLRGGIALAALVVVALTMPNAGAQLPQGVRTPRVRPPIATAVPYTLVVQPAAPPGTCAAPTLAQCKTVPYLLSACGQANQKACQTLMEPEYRAYFNGLPGPVNRPVFPIGKPTLFGNLKNAKYHAAPIVKNVTKYGTSVRGARGAALASVGAVDPKTYVANPQWEGNGSMESCDEYVYEKYYDWSRWMDAVRFCRGDYGCVADVAFVAGAPGIANRELRSKYGARLEQPRVELPKAKNVFFSRGAALIGAGGVQSPFAAGYIAPMSFDQLKAKFPQHAADLDQLRAALDDGATFYDTKAGGGVNEVYANPWDFHAKMRQRTKAVTENESEELERRRKELEHWLDTALAPPTRKMPVAVNKFMAPGSDVELVMGPDPFARTNLWQMDGLRGARESSLNQIQGVQNGPALRFSIPASVVDVLGAVAPKSASPQAGAPITNPPVLAASLVPQVYCAPPPVLTYDQGAKSAMSNADVDRKNQTEVAKHAACRVMNLVLDEWWRLKAAKASGGCNDRGSCGCLDLGNYACDWSPKMFWEAYGKALPPTTAWDREKDFDYCKRWAYMPWTAIPAASKKLPGELEKFLQAEQARIEGIAKRIPQKRNPPNSATWDGMFGQDVGDEEVEGDEDAWSAGYKYDVGWAVKANTWKNLANGQRRPCSLEGHARAGFWVKMTTPIDGALPGSIANVWRHAVDADAWVRANELDPVTKKPNGEMRYESHLIVANEELFAEPNKPSYKDNGYKPYNPNDKTTYGSFPLNYAYRPNPTLDVIPSPKLQVTVMAGPVPITGAVWVELFYGAGFEAAANFAKECTSAAGDDLKLFEARVGFVPTAGLDGAMSIGVGIGGIASAGIRGNVNLITATLPLRARAYLAPGANQMMDLGFDMGGDLTLSTLSGRVSLYVEFLLYEEEFELFRWPGLGPERIPLFTFVQEKLPLFSLAALAPK